MLGLACCKQLGEAVAALRAAVGSRQQQSEFAGMRGLLAWCSWQQLPAICEQPAAHRRRGGLLAWQSLLQSWQMADGRVDRLVGG